MTDAQTSPLPVEASPEPQVLEQLRARGTAGSTGRGVAWIGASRFLQQGLQFASSIVLARLLTPSDYGLVAVVWSVLAFAQLITSLGLSAAIVQARSVDDALIDTAFWLGFVMSVVMTVVLLALAIPLADLYGKPRLAGLLAISSLNFLLAFNAVPTALLERVLQFDALAKTEVSSALVGTAVTVVLAAFGVGAASLVLGPLVSTTMMSVQLVVKTRYRPRTGVSRDAASRLWAYSSGLLGFNFVAYWSRNADNLLLGKFVSEQSLGFYSRAYNLMTLPVFQIGAVINRVLFPTFSAAQHDRRRVANGWLSASRLSVSVTLPISITLAASAPDLVRTLYGSKWDGMAIMLCLLALSAPPQIVFATVGAVYQALGETRLLARRGTLTAVMTVSGAAAGLNWGAVGVCTALLITAYLTVLLAFPPVLHMLSMPASRLVANFRGATIASCVLGGAIVAVRIAVPGRGAGPLVLELAAGGVAYAAALFVFDRPTATRLAAPVLGRLRRSAA